MIPLRIEDSTPEERRQWLIKAFPCISDCEQCGLCKMYHNQDVELVYEDYIKGIKTFEEISKDYRRI